MVDNLFKNLPDTLDEEVFEDLLTGNNVRVERILSHGQTTPRGEWYDQEQHEWVILLKGGARIGYDNGREISLEAGDHVNIPAHCRHRVTWTDPQQVTVWLAVFYDPAN
ncbi:cupin domain-containing protein [Pseudomaricurvus alkylphenolicus]|uniref:cupin domain-containing protein n=1 Tax=Pseudomaricurvus alkylphenolicus TaxID=1306991 RepID=UPI0030B89244